jgi:hypothetical protein
MSVALSEVCLPNIEDFLENQFFCSNSIGSSSTNFKSDVVSKFVDKLEKANSKIFADDPSLKQKLTEKLVLDKEKIDENLNKIVEIDSIERILKKCEIDDLDMGYSPPVGGLLLGVQNSAQSISINGIAEFFVNSFVKVTQAIEVVVNGLNLILKVCDFDILSGVKNKVEKIIDYIKIKIGFKDGRLIPDKKKEKEILELADIVFTIFKSMKSCLLEANLVGVVCCFFELITVLWNHGFLGEILRIMLQPTNVWQYLLLIGKFAVSVLSAAVSAGAILIKKFIDIIIHAAEFYFSIESLLESGVSYKDLTLKDLPSNNREIKLFKVNIKNSENLISESLAARGLYLKESSSNRFLAINGIVEKKDFRWVRLIDTDYSNGLNLKIYFEAAGDDYLHAYVIQNQQKLYLLRNGLDYEKWEYVFVCCSNSEYFNNEQYPKLKFRVIEHDDNFVLQEYKVNDQGVAIHQIKSTMTFCCKDGDGETAYLGNNSYAAQRIYFQAFDIELTD